MQKIINYIENNARGWFALFLWVGSLWFISAAWQGEDLFILKLLAFIGSTSICVKIAGESEHSDDIDWGDMSTKLSNMKK